MKNEFERPRPDMPANDNLTKAEHRAHRLRECNLQIMSMKYWLESERKKRGASDNGSEAQRRAEAGSALQALEESLNEMDGLMELAEKERFSDTGTDAYVQSLAGMARLQATFAAAQETVEDQ